VSESNEVISAIRIVSHIPATHAIPHVVDGTYMEADERAFSVQEFCKRYGIGRSSAYQEIRAGRLKCRKLGARTLVPHDSAEEWLASLPKIGGHP
jgi:excisionase family DNA binding protein